MRKVKRLMMKKYLLGILYLALGGYSLCAQDFSKALSAYRATQYDQAAMHIEQAIQHTTESKLEKTWRYRGMIYYNIANGSAWASQFPDAAKLAMESYMKASELDSTGESKFEIQMAKGALLAFMLDCGAIQFNAGDYCGAVKSYDVAVALSEHIGMLDTLALYNKAYCYYQCGNLDGARIDFTRCAEKGYGAPSVYLYLADIYKKLDKQAELKEFLRTYRKNNPRNPDLLRMEVNLIIQEEQKYTGAEEHLRNLVKSDPGNENYHLVLGLTFELQNKFAEADEEFKKAFGLKANYFEAYLNVGESYYYRGFNYYSEECANIPQNEQERFDNCREKTMVFYRLSIEMLEKAYQLDPANLEVMQLLHDAYVGIDDSEGAERMKQAMKR